MERQPSFTDIEFGNRKRRTKRDEFLRVMEEIIPWEEWVELIQPHYPAGKRGRPPKEMETMLRMLLLQGWFNLSDEGIEDAIYDSYAMGRFVGVNYATGGQVPDATTLCKFRKRMRECGLLEAMFRSITDLLTRCGRMMQGGSIVDATIIQAPSSTKNAEQKRDPEMHQVKKGNEWYFGMRTHVGVDAGTGFVHEIAVTPANTAEVKVAPQLIRAEDEVVYGDAGYLGLERYVQREKPLVYRINEQRGTLRLRYPNGPGMAWAKHMESRKSSVRSKVEYVFLIVKRLFGWQKVRYRGLEKNLNHAWLLLPAPTCTCGRSAVGLPGISPGIPMPSKGRENHKRRYFLFCISPFTSVLPRFLPLMKKVTQGMAFFSGYLGPLQPLPPTRRPRACSGPSVVAAFTTVRLLASGPTSRSLAASRQGPLGPRSLAVPPDPPVGWVVPMYSLQRLIEESHLVMELDYKGILSP